MFSVSTTIPGVSDRLKTSHWSSLGLSLLLLLSGLSAAFADSQRSDHYLVVQTLSLHFEKFDERNGFNPTLGYEYSPGNQTGWQFGVFRDSFDYTSGYLGLNLKVFDFTIAGRRIKTLMTLNAVHKQFKKVGGGETRIIPFPILDVSLPARFHLNISGVPQIPEKRIHTNGLLFFQLKYNLL